MNALISVFYRLLITGYCLPFSLHRMLTKNTAFVIPGYTRVNPRLRMNHNLHHSYDSPAQRLFNALEPGTVLPVHRHRHTDETYIMVRGRLVVIFYNDQGEETARAEPISGTDKSHI